MKLKPGQVDSFLRAPDKSIRAALIYGPDSGLVRERAHQIAKTVVPALDDPFLVSELDGSALAEEPSRLSEEAAAISMTGGQRVVLVRGCSDNTLKSFEYFLEELPGDGLVVASAGDLAAKSKLRKLFEGAKAGAAIACYLDDADSLSRLIDQRFKEDDIKIEPDARDYLVTHLGADRGLSRAEIDKLALYAGPGGKLTFDDVSAAIGDSAASAMDDVIYSAADGDAASLDRALDQSFALGLSPVPLLRQTAAHMVKLRQVRGAVDSGADLESAIKGLRPPIFWKVKNRFSGQVRRLGPKPLGEALNLLLEAEAACKRTGVPDTLVASRALHQVAAIARHAGRRR